MISSVEFNALIERVDVLETLVKALSQKGSIPDGMAPLTTLASEMGLSTSKAEELARNCGVVIARHGHGFIVHEARFREAAVLIIKAAKRKYGSKYWYHPLIGKFTMSVRPQV